MTQSGLIGVGGISSSRIWDRAAAANRAASSVLYDERIARFSDFNVWRARLTDDAQLVLPDHVPYAVCMCIDGDVAIGTVQLAAEEAALIPAGGIASTALAGSGRLLIAAPGL